MKQCQVFTVFTKRRKRTRVREDMRHLKELYFVKLSEGENILDVQREHPISLLFPVLLNILVVLVLIVSSYAVFTQSFPVPFIGSLMVDVTLIILVFLAISGTHVFMNWYYHFYVVTNKRIISRQFFRLSGEDIDEIYYTVSPIQEVDRKSPNIILDLLGVEDIYIFLVET